MVQQEEMSSLFPVFALSIVALIAIPWTIVRIISFLGSKSQSLQCQCSVCQKCPKNKPSLSERVRSIPPAQGSEHWRPGSEPT